MALTPLPTIEVNDAQAAKLLEVYGSVENYTTWLTQMVIEKVKQFEQAKIQVAYRQALDDLEVQEQAAMDAVDQMLADLATG